MEAPHTGLCAAGGSDCDFQFLAHGDHCLRREDLGYHGGGEHLVGEPGLAARRRRRVSADALAFDYQRLCCAPGDPGRAEPVAEGFIASSATNTADLYFNTSQSKVLCPE